MIVFFLYLYLRRRQVDENMGGFVGIRAFVAMIYWRQRLTFRFRNFSVLKLLLISWGFWFQFRRIWSRKKVLVSVSEKFGLGKKSRFWFQKIWSRKKVSVSVSENFVSDKKYRFRFRKIWSWKKSFGFGFGKFGIGKKISVSVSVKILVSSFSVGGKLWRLWNLEMKLRKIVSKIKRVVWR